MSLVIALVFASESHAQTKIVFAKGKTEKTLTIKVPAGVTKLYSVAVKKDQVINAGVEGDIGVSKNNDFPVISLNLQNPDEELDRWQDGEGYLSVLTGKKGTYVISVFNSDKKRARTFKLKVSITNDLNDFMGGEEVEEEN